MKLGADKKVEKIVAVSKAYKYTAVLTIVAAFLLLILAFDDL